MKATTLFIAIGIMLSTFAAKAQDKFFTRNGTIVFFSTTPVEDIKAENFNVTAVLDAATGQLEFSVLMKSFNFKKALMQEHFNENYVESDKFPKASFKGNIAEAQKLDLTKDGTHQVNVAGDLTIHGVTRQVSAPGTLEVKDGKVTASSKFMVNPEDHDIEIPAVVRDKIAKELEVSVNVTMEALKR